MKEKENAQHPKESGAQDEGRAGIRPNSTPACPVVSDPPVPNRAHTEMRVDCPPRAPKKPKKTL